MHPEATALTIQLSPPEVLEAISMLRRYVVDDRDRLRLLPTSFYEAHASKTVALWGILMGIFVFPTVELVDWLQRRVIRGRRAIEIGAGVGDLGRFLGIPTTDSYHIVDDEGVARRFREAGHIVPVLDPSVTERLDAAAAIAKYQPEVVISGWSVGLEAGEAWAVDECAIVRTADYCILGHLIAHQGKAVRALAHKELDLRWLVSRAMARTLNRVWLFSKQPAATIRRREVPHGL